MDKLESFTGAPYVLPEGPERIVRTDGRRDARGWWRLDLSAHVDVAVPGALPDLSTASPPGLSRARRQVSAFLDELETRHGVRSDRVILGGFSQGAMVALDVALNDGRPLRGVALLSGTLVNERGVLARVHTRRGLRVLVAHSPEDQVLPFELASRLARTLGEGGWRVTWLPFGGGHAITAEVVDALGVFTRSCS